MEATIRVLRAGDGFIDQNRVFIYEEISDKTPTIGCAFERLIKVPANANRHNLHDQYGGVIEWSGDVSVYTDKSYCCYTIDDADVIPPMMRLLLSGHGYVSATKTIDRMMSNDRFAADVFSRAYEKYIEDAQTIELHRRICYTDAHIFGSYACPWGPWVEHRGTDKMIEWQICFALDLMTTGSRGQMIIDRARYEKFIADPKNWRQIPPIDKNGNATATIRGWAIAGVTAIHSPMFGAAVAIPPMSLSFMTIEDDFDDPPPFESIDASTSSSIASRESRDEKHRRHIEKLERQNQRLVAYINDLANRLNLRLPERLQIQSADSIMGD